MNYFNIKNSISMNACINGGYGEYIVYKPHLTSLDKKIYEKCYKVFIQAKQTPNKEKQTFLKRKLTRIDPSLKSFFIPRTLYDLCFIEKCIEERLKKGEHCKNALSNMNASESECWHGAIFKDFGNDRHPVIISLAERLNKSIAEELKPTSSEGLCYEQILSMTTQKLQFLNNCHKSSGSDTYRTLLKATFFGHADVVNHVIAEAPMGIGIATDEMKKIVLNAVALECSELAKGKLLLYRGSSISRDKPLEYTESGKVDFVQSLSFGTSLFAGGMYDPSAAAFHYIRRPSREGFAILVPQKKATLSPFAIPQTHPLCQMVGQGEEWHARSRTPTVGVDTETSMGCKTGVRIGKVGYVASRFRLAVTPQQFESKFQHYMKHCCVKIK